MKKFIFIFCMTMSLPTFADISHDITNKIPGDIIAPQFDEQIAQWCDFNKQIVVTRTNVLCVYNGKGALNVSQKK